MNTKKRNFLMLALLSISFTAFAHAAQAQWEITKTRADDAGHLVFLEERTRRGDIRTTTYTYIPRTNIVALQRATTRMRNGSIFVRLERRDNLDRLVLMSNEKVDPAGRFSGSRQRWTYMGPADRRGRYTTYRYDHASGTWQSI